MRYDDVKFLGSAALAYLAVVVVGLMAVTAVRSLASL
jgi:hypothetical protein